MEANRIDFPFTAVIGQDELKQALLLNCVDPFIGGVMVIGDRGTGKSTTIRALVDILPPIATAPGYNPYNLPPISSVKDTDIVYKKIPMIELPLGATEDRVCGTLDLEKAVKFGTSRFEPGILAQANRGILYVDEINLLDDHLIDVLLDSSASGWNVVEREGISIRHPAKFILIGSGNPEEGDLRPQLLDRFGLQTIVKTIINTKLRVRIVKQRKLFDDDPKIFIQRYQTEQDTLRDKIITARTLLNEVILPDMYSELIACLCSKLKIDGLRGDIVTTRATKAHVALRNALCALDTWITKAQLEDVKSVVHLCLRHRLKRGPLDIGNSDFTIMQMFEEVRDRLAN